MVLISLRGCNNYSIHLVFSKVRSTIEVSSRGVFRFHVYRHGGKVFFFFSNAKALLVFQIFRRKDVLYGSRNVIFTRPELRPPWGKGRGREEASDLRRVLCGRRDLPLVARRVVKVLTRCVPIVYI